MSLNRRLEKLQSSLSADKQFHNWLEGAKKAGGFTPYWQRALKGPLTGFEWMRDEEANFKYALVCELNLTVLKEHEVAERLYPILFIALDRLCRQVIDVKVYLVRRESVSQLTIHCGSYLCSEFKAFTDETLVRAAAIDVISKTYFEGEDILFGDAQQVRDSEIKNLSKTAELFAPLAAWLQAEWTTPNSVAPDASKINAAADRLVNKVRASVLMTGGTRGEFIGALKRAYPEFLESNPATSD